MQDFQSQWKQWLAINILRQLSAGTKVNLLKIVCGKEQYEYSYLSELVETKKGSNNYLSLE